MARLRPLANRVKLFVALVAVQIAGGAHSNGAWGFSSCIFPVSSTALAATAIVIVIIIIVVVVVVIIIIIILIIIIVVVDVDAVQQKRQIRWFS